MVRLEVTADILGHICSIETPNSLTGAVPSCDAAAGNYIPYFAFFHASSKYFMQTRDVVFISYGFPLNLLNCSLFK